jgi:hypothetical protein
MNDDHSARLSLPYLAAGQMQKHVTLNEALTRLDTLVQTVAASRTVTAQPAGPADGVLYLLPAGATGPAWAGRPEGTLIRAEGGGWSAVAAPDGLIVLVEDAGEMLVRDGGAWVPLGARLGVAQGLERLGLGTTADVDNPFAVRLNKALWTALETGAGGDGDLRLTLNKEAPADVLSLLFQSGYGGRAELGLIGDDHLALKVSADGVGWTRAFAVDPGGRVTFDGGAAREETIVMTASGTWTPPVWARVVEALCVGGGGGGGAGAFGPAGARYGGGGGGAGGLSVGRWGIDDLPASLSVTIGAGGAGGSAAAGQAGGATTISAGGVAILSGLGGGGGGLGTASSGIAGAGGLGAPGSNAGGPSNVTSSGSAGRTYDRPDSPGGGGAGGGVDAAGVARAGGPGGEGAAIGLRVTGGPAGSGAAGQPGGVSSQPHLGLMGGGGGGGGASAAGAGHAGGPGGAQGAGGGAGGAGVTSGGVGGAGASGAVILRVLG